MLGGALIKVLRREFTIVEDEARSHIPASKYCADLPNIVGINAFVHVTKENRRKACLFKPWLWFIVLFVSVSNIISLNSHPQIMSQ